MVLSKDESHSDLLDHIRPVLPAGRVQETSLLILPANKFHCDCPAQPGSTIARKSCLFWSEWKAQLEKYMEASVFLILFLFIQNLT